MDLFASIFSGGWLLILLMVAFASETIIVHRKAGNYLGGSPGANEGNHFSEVRKYSDKAITLAGITFAIIAIVPSLKGESVNFLEVILIFTFSLFLFLFCFKLDVIAGTKRKYWDIQQRLFNYGLLALVVGLNKYFEVMMKEMLFLIMPLSAIFFIVHFYEFKGDLRIYTFDQNKGKNG